MTEDRFDAVRCTSPDGASFGVCRHGGQLLSFVPRGGREVLFVSERAVRAEGAAIRGGVPVIFPQFAGRGPLPKHGFARTARWTLEATGLTNDGAAFARLSLTDDATSRALWPASFRLTTEIRAKDQGLEQSLAVTNTGGSAFRFTAALHGYFALADVRRASIEGLASVDFEDHARVRSPSAPIRFETEVDRVYREAPPIRVIDGCREISLRCEGFREWVVWNPGDAIAEGLADLGAVEGRRFVCAEPAIARTPVELAPGRSWQGMQRIVVEGA